jgi:uncharacterized membrane protein
MTWANLIVITHILAAMTWVGGMVFLAVVVVPVTRKLEPSMRSAVLNGLGRRFRLLGWASLAVLVVTGFLNAGRVGYSIPGLVSGEWSGSDFGRMLVVKLALVFAVLVLTGAHDLLSTSSGPLLPSLSRLTARLSFLLSIAIVTLATLLVRPVQ